MSVRVDGLSLAYRKTRVLDKLDLSLDGGVHGLLGPNGAGKTTLVRVLATVLPPHEGTVRLLGNDVTNRRERTELRRRLGYLPQQLGYFPGFTVREFVEYMAWLKEVPAARVPAAVDDALERVDLTERADSRMRTLSGGMLRRAGIAQAIVNNPELLLLDEPTAGMGVEDVERTVELIQRVRAGRTVVLVEHNMKVVGSLADRVTVLQRGSILVEGPYAEVRADPRVIAAYLGEAVA